jgi:Flp pilus assembly protein CpaB
MRGVLSRYRLRNTVVAGGLALVGVLLVFLYVTGYRHDVQHGANLVQVFVAARDIPQGTTGAAVAGGGYVERASVLRRNVVAGAISSTDQIANLAAGSTIVSGEQISVKQFQPVAQQGVLSAISGNQRAMTVPGDANQLLSGIVKDGDHVDVLVNFHYSINATSGSTGTGSLSRVITRIVLRDLLVLRAPTSSSGGSITLALTDTQAQKLLFAIKNGEWWLVLRPVARPADSPESIETIIGLLTDGLGPSAQQQLTGGYGAGSLSSG